MVDGVLEIATNGLKWARERESERLDQERDFVEWGPGDKNDEIPLIVFVPWPPFNKVSFLIQPFRFSLPRPLQAIRRDLENQVDHSLNFEVVSVLKFQFCLLAERKGRLSVGSRHSFCSTPARRWSGTL